MQNVRFAGTKKYRRVTIWQNSFFKQRLGSSSELTRRWMELHTGEFLGKILLEGAKDLSLEKRFTFQQENGYYNRIVYIKAQSCLIICPINVQTSIQLRICCKIWNISHSRMNNHLRFKMGNEEDLPKRPAVAVWGDIVEKCEQTEVKTDRNEINNYW